MAPRNDVVWSRDSSIMLAKGLHPHIHSNGVNYPAASTTNCSNVAQMKPHYSSQTSVETSSTVVSTTQGHNGVIPPEQSNSGIIILLPSPTLTPSPPPSPNHTHHIFLFLSYSTLLSLPPYLPL